jgi:hypothetical protein
MVSPLQEVDPAVRYQIDNSVFLGKPSGPGSTGKEFQGFGFPDPRKRIAKDGFYEVESAKGHLLIRLDPKS